MSAVRRFHCNWSEANKLASELLGVIRFVSGVPDFTTPLPMPGGLKFLIVDTIDIEPLDGESPDGDTSLTLATSAATYERGGAIVTAAYKSVDLNQDDNRPETPQGTYLTIRGSMGVEYQTLPGRTWKWKDNGKPLPDDISAGLIKPTGQISANWQRVVQPPDDTIRSLRGLVNNAPFLGNDEGTVLFMGCQKTRQFQFEDNNALYDLEYNFSVNDKGWNFFYDPKRGDWFEIQAAVGGDPPYPSGDLNELFGYNG